MKILFALFASLLVAHVAFGTTVYQSSIDELFAESSLVVFGLVEAGRIIPENCGVEYAVRIHEVYKGSVTPGELIWFEKYGPMDVGRNYFLFMSTQENAFRPISSTNSFSEPQSQEGIIKCKKHTPIYTVNVWGEGAFASAYTYNSKVPQAVFFDDFMFSVPKELVATKVKPTERYDNDQRDTALDPEEFKKYLKKSASAKQTSNVASP